MKISDKTRTIEISAVFLTGIGKFMFMDMLNLRLLFISVACSFWIAYMIYRARKNKEIFIYWGMSKKNFKKTFLEFLPVFIGSVILFVWIGNRMNTNIINWSILPILLLYPIWGIIQQFVIIALLARNFKDMNRFKMSNPVIILITAVIFAGGHYPHYLLIVGTFVLALVYTGLYLKGRNLIVMGIYHGWIGAVFFYTLLERDPWKEVFEMIPF